MGKFLTQEKSRYTEFKTTTSYFSDAARQAGVYKGHSYAFCLPLDCAAENLFIEIRDPVRDYFADKAIKWHDGHNRKDPSNHLCDSQVCCVNFLFPFADKPQALAKLLRPVFPDIREMLPVEDEHYVACEWIGQENYLGEIKAKNRKRTRGAVFTSADAAVRFRREDGRIQMVLIEWKYTEAYYRTSLVFARSGRNRADIYRRFFQSNECPLIRERIPAFEDLFYEPFYQLMRQQFLAREMEQAHEQQADTVSLLHIAPAKNLDFRRITSPALQTLGASATEVWGKLVRDRSTFTSVSTEALFGRFDRSVFPELASWWDYISARYSWVKDQP